MPATLDGIELNRSLSQFGGHQFRLTRNLMNWVAVSAFHSKALTRFIYDSSIADLGHRVLYSVRKHKLVARILYGQLGPPEIEGRRTRI